eukprot:TRINITY_DN2813_c0_g1_i1.p1 TRINITY_DN2813_c0_g1~~TRINITY_DN2813_c0_g1_i1.p1  ORF type:complete len:621 (+),score=191.75 TRINITY_DN2813_c0_g1_i1:48-1865(+)
MVDEFTVGEIFSVSGPVVVADNLWGAGMHEVVKVGHDQLIGEIIKLTGASATIQVYEETSGLTVGDPVFRTGLPLSVELGPGLLGNIFDGIMNPLDDVQDLCKSVFIPKGVQLATLDRNFKWFFHHQSITVGDVVSTGDAYGWVQETALVKHFIMIPPDVSGTVTYIAPEGEYTVDEIMLRLKTPTGEEKELKMYHLWPVRHPRPIKDTLVVHEPLLTGQRVLDALFPVAQGGTCCIPGAFGCGKTVISHAVAKHSNADVIISCMIGERGNEVAEALMEFPHLTMRVGDGDEVSIMERTVVIANTSNMAVAARESSIFVAATVAEYYRDMGYSVAMMGDSSSRWAEALREISGRLAEMPADGGYPAYLATRLHSFYERAGRAAMLGTPAREGCVTFINAVSPPGGDFSEPVTTATLAIVQNFWALDKKLAQRKHFPAINWLKSYSKAEATLLPQFNEKYPDYEDVISKTRNILQKEDALQATVTVIGKDAIAESDKVVLEAALMIKEDFLQQNSFTPNDCTCPFYKTYHMLRNIIHWYDLAKNLIRTNKDMTVQMIKHQQEEIMDSIARQKYTDPYGDEEENCRYYLDLFDQITEVFRAIEHHLE